VRHIVALCDTLCDILCGILCHILCNTYCRPPSPPADVKPLIDRLISYVKKDGEAFEKQVLSRQDDRFSFLQPGSDYYDYYVWRKHVELVGELSSHVLSEPSCPIITRLLSQLL